MNQEQKEVLLGKKNEHYLELIQEMDQDEILPVFSLHQTSRCIARFLLF